jgi:hypothetical protein
VPRAAFDFEALARELGVDAPGVVQPDDRVHLAIAYCEMGLFAEAILEASTALLGPLRSKSVDQVVELLFARLADAATMPSLRTRLFPG